MDSKEAMKKAIDGNVASIAKSLKISPSALKNQYNMSNRRDLIAKFIDFVNACGNDIAIKWASEELNGVFIKNPEISDAYKLDMADCIPNSLKEFGEVVKEITDALKDGKIDKEETKKIRKEWEDLKYVLESFVLSCEYPS